MIKAAAAQSEGRRRQTPTFLSTPKMQSHGPNARRPSVEKGSPSAKFFENNLNLRRKKLPADLMPGKDRFLEDANSRAIRKSSQSRNTSRGSRADNGGARPSGLPPGFYPALLQRSVR